MCRIGIDNYSDRKNIEYLLEGHSLALHLLPDGVN